VSGSAFSSEGGFGFGLGFSFFLVTLLLLLDQIRNPTSTVSAQSRLALNGWIPETPKIHPSPQFSGSQPGVNIRSFSDALPIVQRGG
jgi:hypothetical protein